MTANALSSCFSLEFEEGGNIRGGSGSWSLDPSCFLMSLMSFLPSGYRGCIRTHGEHVLEQVLQLAPLDLEWEVDGLLLCGIAGATTTGLSWSEGYWNSLSCCHKAYVPLLVITVQDAWACRASAPCPSWRSSQTPSQ
jgi:hypothetical protein